MGDWLPGVKVMRGRSDGGSMLGGPPRWVWHTFEAPVTKSAAEGAAYLIDHGTEVHFTFNVITGEIVQLLPASRAGRGLRNRSGGVQTNRQGDFCLQVEVMAYAKRPWTAQLTPAGRAGLARLVGFARSHGIPNLFPAGPPPAYPPGAGNRSETTWKTRAGHYGHSQVPENDHGDPGAIDPAVIFGSRPEPEPKPKPGKDEAAMDLYRSADGKVWDIGEMGRRHVTHPDVVAVYLSKPGRVVAPIGAVALNKIPLIPDVPDVAEIVSEVKKILPAPLDIDDLVARIVEAVKPVTAELAVDYLPSEPGEPASQQV